MLELVPGGAAEQEGSICVGDLLVEVNGINLRGKSHQEVVDLLTSGFEITIVVENVRFSLKIMPTFITCGCYFEWKLRKLIDRPPTSRRS